MRQCGIQTKMSTNCHHQTDGATEAMNRITGNYLRGYWVFHQQVWNNLLTTAEFAYNSANVDFMTMSSFEIYLGWSLKSTLETLHCMRPDSVQTVIDFKVKLEETSKTATFAQRLTQARQAA